MTKTTPSYIDYYIGRKLKMLRLKQGKNLHDIAKILDVSFQQIQKYEKGTNKLSSSKLYTMTQVFSIPVNYFFDGMPKSDDTANYDIN